MQKLWSRDSRQCCILPEMRRKDVYKRQVYEDIIEGIRGAKAGGFLAVGVYERQYKGSYEEMKQESDVYIHSFEELI